MKRLIVELRHGNWDERDPEVFAKFAANATSITIEAGRAHENQELADEGVAQTLSISSEYFTVKLEE